VPVEAPPRPPEQDELDALIEEARRRARRRRLAYISILAAVAFAAAGSYLLIGGGNSGSPRALRGEPGSGAATAPKPNRAARAYRCPTSLTALKRSSPRSGIPGCNIHFWATLPAGWREVPKRAAVFPPNAIVSEPLGPPAIRFANFPLHPARFEPPSAMPHPLPADGIAIVISAEAPLNGGSPRIHPKDLGPADFDAVGSSGVLIASSLATGGWRFKVLVRSGADREQHESLVEATSVLNSIVTTQHLCPCGRHGGRSR
jgi:hypothetical protein